MISRVLIVLAALMGAAGVALAAIAAHGAGAARLGPASGTLLFHAPAVLAALLLAEQRLVQRSLGLIAALGFVVAAALFAADLSARQYLGSGLFPMAAPTGGTLLIASWIALGIAALLPRR